MKSASQISLSKAWWTKEAPDGLKKSGVAFEKALTAFAKADAALGKGKPQDEIDDFEAALAALSTAGKQVATEAKDLEKKQADKKLKSDLSNTVAVMGRPLAKAIETERKKLEPLEEAVAAGAFGSPEEHKAFLNKWAPKIKRGTISFAIGLPSNKPEEMRFNFHVSKDPRGLANPLKKHAHAKKFTFGRAGTLKLAEEVGEDDVGARTLCLYLDGRRIPGLAKRVKLMLKKLGVSQFGRVKILEGELELDAADDDMPDNVAIEDVDLDAPDELPDPAPMDEPQADQPHAGGPQHSDVEPPQPEPEPAPPPPPVAEDTADAGVPLDDPAAPPRDRLVALQPRYTEIFQRLKSKMDDLRPEEIASLKTALMTFGDSVRSRQPSDAAKIVSVLEACLSGQSDLASLDEPPPGRIKVRIKASPLPPY